MNTIVFDNETTGLPLHPTVDINKQPRIIEFGAAIIDENGEVVEKYNQLINPGTEIESVITKITGITNDDLIGKPKFGDVLLDIRALFEKCDIMVAHNLPFDYRMLDFELTRLDFQSFPFPRTKICTVEENREAYGFRPNLQKLYNDTCGKPLQQTHRAIDDVMALVEIWTKGGYHDTFVKAALRNEL